MYSVEITVEKDKVTGETRVLASTTSLPRGPLPQGIKVYEDETKGTRPPPRPCLAPFPGLSQIRQPDWTRRCPVWVPGLVPCCPLLAPKPFSPEPAAHPSSTPGTCPGAWLSTRCQAGLWESHVGLCSVRGSSRMM